MFNLSHDPWVWVAAILSLFIFSFLYRDNPLYRFAEHLLVGVSAGYYLAIYWHNSIYPNIISHVKAQEWLYLFPLFLGLLYFAVFVPKHGYLIRWPIAFLLGTGSGVVIPATFQANIYKQVEGTLLNSPASYPAPLDFVNAIIIFLGVLLVLSYFFFSREHTGPLKISSKLGIWILMIGFGASFGYTVMARVSLLIGRLHFLLGTWLGILRF